MFQTIQQPFISNSTEVKRRRRSKLLSKADFSNIIIKKMRKLLIGILGQKNIWVKARSSPYLPQVSSMQGSGRVRVHHLVEI